MSETKERKWKVVRTSQFEEDFNKLSPEDQAEVEKTIQKIAENPYIGEPDKPCPNCGEYFFHSDIKCPSCGVSVKGVDEK